VAVVAAAVMPAAAEAPAAAIAAAVAIAATGSEPGAEKYAEITEAVSKWKRPLFLRKAARSADLFFAMK